MSDYIKAFKELGDATQRASDAMALAVGRAFIQAAAQQYDPDAWMYQPHPHQRWFVRAGFVIIGAMLGVIVYSAGRAG